MFNPKEKLPTTSEDSDRPKEMEEVSVFQPNSRVVVDAVEENAADETSQDSSHVPSSSDGDVHESRGSSVQGGAERSLRKAVPTRVSPRTIRLPESMVIGSL